MTKIGEGGGSVGPVSHRYPHVQGGSRYYNVC